MIKPYLLISACLLGTPCRYDGKSKPMSDDTLKKLNEKYTLIPICPEMMGGLPAPRVPSERQGARVVNAQGVDVTSNYRRGAEEALALAKKYDIKTALLKERSPSCGAGTVYDGTFTNTLIRGNGVTVDMLLKENIEVFGESKVFMLL
ncbi:MAG: DUF523 domain-containing protein [Clostridia bacterium]|nr:DUF523 domain-containing protein [Clostridia bacterium]